MTAGSIAILPVMSAAAAGSATRTGNVPTVLRDMATSTASSYPTLMRWGDRLILSAVDGSGSYSSLLLRAADGQVTRLASDAGLSASGPNGSPWSVATPQGLLLAVNGDLWRTDGTAAGTQDTGIYINYGVAAAGGSVFYEHQAPCAVQRTCDPNTMALWVTDGTNQGKRLLGGPPINTRLSAYDGQVYFGAADSKHGEELWRSNGAKASTVLVRDISPGQGSSYPGNFAVVGGRLFFVADDGVHGREPWVTDGTPQGTHLVRDIAPGRTGSQPPHGPLFLPLAAGVHGVAYFAASDGRHGRELWRSDGTTHGTWLVRDFPGSSSPENLTSAGGRLWYSAVLPGHGREIFVSVGSAAGTRMVRDLAGGSPSSVPDEFTALGNRVYFAATTTAGCELWRTDGTGRGTRLARDISPGAASSAPKQLLRVGSTVFFAASEPNHGRELWSVHNGKVALADDINQTAT